MVDTLRAQRTPRATALAAAISVMFVFLLRISEIAQTSVKRGLSAAYLRHGDVQFTADQGNLRVGIDLRDTKSDPFSLVARSLPSVARNDIYDIMHRVHSDNVDLARRRNYTEQQLNEMPFININGVPLERADVADTIKNILSSPEAPAGLPDPARYSTHSLRKGGATELLRMGIDIATIKFLGRWKSMAWLLYAHVSDDCLNRAGSVMAAVLL